MPRRRDRAAFPRRGDDASLTRRAVDAERFARNDRFCSAGEQPFDRAHDRAGVTRTRIDDLRRERGARAERNRRYPFVDALEPAEGTVQADDADLRDVAFEQRVRRLGRRVRDERDPRSIDAGRAQRPPQALDDSGGHALGSVVRRRHLHARYDRPRPRLNDNDVGKRTPHVDADAEHQSPLTLGEGPRHLHTR